MSEYYPFLHKSIPLGILPFCKSPVLRNNDLVIISEITSYDEYKNYFVCKWENDPIFIQDCFDVKDKDIDVFWAGSFPDMSAAEAGEPPAFWTRGKGLDSFNYVKRSLIFKELCSIRDRRKDLNIVCLDKKVPLKEYFSLISRSKICIETPGVGQLNKRFIEYMLLDK